MHSASENTSEKTQEVAPIEIQKSTRRALRNKPGVKDDSASVKLINLTEFESFREGIVIKPKENVFDDPWLE